MDDALKRGLWKTLWKTCGKPVENLWIIFLPESYPQNYPQSYPQLCVFYFSDFSRYFRVIHIFHTPYYY